MIAMYVIACAPGVAVLTPSEVGWTPCDDGFLCADLPVDGGEVAVAWHPAPDPNAPFAVMAQGGPGSSSIDLLRVVHGVYADFDPVLWTDRHWVALDTRGTGASDPVACVDGTWTDRLRVEDPVPRSEGAADVQRALRDEFQAGCADEPLARLGTATAADDLEAFREALGAETLDLIGYSYGTWLGAVYAAAHPDRVGRFVLDGAIQPDPTRDAFLAAQAAGFELALERFFDRCDADPDCPLDDAAAVFDALLAATPLPAPSDPWGRVLTRTDLRWGVATLLYGPDDATLADALALAGDGDAAGLLAAADDGWGRNPTTGQYATNLQGYFAIGCLDRPWPADWTEDDVWAFGAALDAAYPRLGEGLLTGELACHGWPVSAPTPAVAAPDAPPMLVVNGAYDPATPLDGAILLRDALANDSALLTYGGDGHVAMFSDPSGCSYLAERAFLVDGTLPAADCP